MSQITEATAAEQAALGARAIAAVEALELMLAERIETSGDNRSEAASQMDRETWRARESAYRDAQVILRRAMRGEGGNV